MKNINQTNVDPKQAENEEVFFKRLNFTDIELY